MITTLILPGLGNSGPDHWQTRWLRLYPAMQKVEQENWDSPRCVDWVQGLDKVVVSVSGEVVLVAHSSACALVAHWVQKASQVQVQKVLGALLVAPSDPDGPNYPIGPVGFGPVPMQVLPFTSIVVASTNDPYITLDRAQQYASAWHSRLVVVQNAGHINAASGLGDWPEGLALVKELRGIG